MAQSGICKSRSKAIEHILGHCGGVTSHDHVLLIWDETTQALGASFVASAWKLGAFVSVAQIPKLERHGLEPPDKVALQMLAADLIICLSESSLAHSKARKEATGRFLSLPGYTWELLDHPAVMVDYQAQESNVNCFANAFTRGSEIRVATKTGTNITMRINGRRGNSCPGFVRNPGDLGSPPDIEANVAPIENNASGIIFSDSPRQDLLLENSRAFGLFPNPKHCILGECGVGLNPLAKICGNLLVDEGAFGSVHFGFGSNRAHGGQNDTDFHQDFVVANASLWVDDVQMLKEGHIC